MRTRDGVATPRARSLRWRVAAWLLPPLVVFAASNAAIVYRTTGDAANRAYDRSLVASLKAIAEGTHSIEGDIQVDIPGSAFAIFERDVQERIFYAVRGPDGALLTGYEDLPVPDETPADGEARLADVRYHGQNVRLGALAKRLYDPVLAGGDRVLILFAETVDARRAFARQLFLESLRRQMLLILIGAVILYVALTSAVRPLLALRAAVRARASEDLRPIPNEDVPSEVRPLIDAINYHMGRLRAMLDARKRFFADAAHQIRTPLSVISTQTEYGRRQHDPEEMLRTFDGLHRSVAGAQRLANQMLAMSRAEVSDGVLVESAPVALQALVREVALELASLAVDRHIELSFDGEAQGITVRGDAQMLRELVSNLIDNAIHYTPEGGHVHVILTPEAGGVRLAVIDDGPGIPAEEREKVFRRFYRLLGRGHAEGSGLGLAIVREICWSHGGRIALEDGPEGRGLAVRVWLPAGEGRE